MSDIKEPEELGRARLEEKLFEIQLSLKKMARRRLEVNYELKKIEENEELLLKAKAEVEQNLK